MRRSCFLFLMTAAAADALANATSSVKTKKLGSAEAARRPSLMSCARKGA